MKKCKKTEVNPLFVPWTKIISPHIEWCFKKCPDLCKKIFKTNTSYLRINKICLTNQLCKSFGILKNPLACPNCDLGAFT